ncbi:Putative outer membrane protein [hydrothermal vent metagenome]|uniref:Outer membrane protein n=1 Tax=hydrothermal vent metagenome TaxID=652676 RepID=A0A3B0ZR29_9ZZZZ
MILHQLYFSQSGWYRQWVFLLSLVLVIYTNTAQAESTSDGLVNQVKDEYWSIQLENDFFAQSGDRYYTHGTEVSRVVMGEPSPWLKDISNLFPAFESDGVTIGVNYSMGQKIFTPDNTRAKELVVDDRPYAGYLYFTAAVLSRISRQNNIDTANLIEFTLGVVGPSALGEEVQTGYHDLIGIDSPNGWDNQLKDEPALGLSYTRFWRHIKPSSMVDYGMTPHVNITLGNVYTYAASGVMFRFGTHLNNDLFPPNIRPGFPGLSFFSPRQQNSWYLFAGIEGRMVARNIFLDGNTFKDSHSVDKKLLVGDFQYGVVFQRGRIRFSISNMIRTKEFKGQKDNTNFGAVNISFLL